MELRPLGEVQALQLHDSVMLHAVGNMNPLIQRQPVDLPKLVINMSTQRTDPVRAKSNSIRIPVIDLVKYFFTAHYFSLPEQNSGIVNSSF